MTGVELLEWEEGVIRFIGKIKNEGSKTYRAMLNVYLCNEKGETLKNGYTLVEYFPDGYTLHEFNDTLENGELGLPPGEEGLFGGSTSTIGIYISNITQPIHYIYIVLDEYFEEWQ